MGEKNGLKEAEALNLLEKEVRFMTIWTFDSGTDV